MSTKTDFMKFSMCVIAWCMCVITAITTVAVYKWYGVQNDWLIGLTVSFVMLASIAFAVLSFLGAVAAIRIKEDTSQPKLATRSSI